MPSITFNAFSFLQKKLQKNHHAYSNVTLPIVPSTTTPNDLLHQFNLSRDDVEVVFINGKVAPFKTPLQDGDRVAFVPPGTPGPYRVHLGFKNKRLQSDNG